MIILFILLSLFLHVDVLALPLRPLHPLQPLHATSEIPFYPLARELEIDLTQRTVYGIIWSCLTTVFVCLWVVVHPNIPGSSDSMFLTRLKIMGCMLIAPELVIVWAGRQWFAARKIAADHKDQDWTTTHGFLVSMGGFVLYSDGKMVRTLDIVKLEELYGEKMIEWPKVTKKEIDDRSKGDFLSKGIAVLQTSWFIAQCILRGGFRLGLTQLELATLAFSALNIALSILWMNKPLGVTFPFEVHLRHDPLASAIGPLHSPPTVIIPFHLRHDPLAPAIGPLHSPPTVTIPLQVHLDPLAPAIGPLHSPPTATSLQVHLRHDPLAPAIGPLHPPPTRHSSQSTFRRFLGFIIEPFNVAWSSMKDLITCEKLPEDPNQFSVTDPVPTFYAPSSLNDVLATFTGLCVGILFGGIHCIAWYFEFPSPTEKFIWRTSAVTITIVPLFFFLIVENVRMHIDDADTSSHDIPSLRILTIYFAIVLYCISRAALIFLPILSLRCLPPEALQDFQWTSYIPHV